MLRKKLDLPGQDSIIERCTARGTGWAVALEVLELAVVAVAVMAAAAVAVVVAVAAPALAPVVVARVAGLVGRMNQ